MLYFVALVDSCVSYSFVAAKLVKKYQLTIILGTSMVVMLADGSQVAISKTCSYTHNYVHYEQKTCVLYDLV